MSPMPPPHPRVSRPLCAERHGLHRVGGAEVGAPGASRAGPPADSLPISGERSRMGVHLRTEAGSSGFKSSQAGRPVPWGPTSVPWCPTDSWRASRPLGLFTPSAGLRREGDTGPTVLEGGCPWRRPAVSQPGNDSGSWVAPYDGQAGNETRTPERASLGVCHARSVQTTPNK